MGSYRPFFEPSSSKLLRGRVTSVVFQAQVGFHPYKLQIDVKCWNFFDKKSNYIFCDISENLPCIILLEYNIMKVRMPPSSIIFLCASEEQGKIRE